MNRMLKLAIISIFAVLISLPLLAQTPEASTFVVDQPLQVGDATLQPGVYTVRLVRSFQDRTKVQFTSPDGNKVYASVLTVPHLLHPNQDDSHPTFVYYKNAAGAPIALRTWYPTTADALGGHDFVYGESRARQLAALSHERVVTYGTTTETAAMETSPLTVITPEATVEPYAAPAPTKTESVTSMTSSTTTTTTTPAPVVETPAPAPQVTESTTATTDTTTTTTTHRHRRMRKD